MNICIYSGRVASEPKITEKDGKKVARYSFAVDGNYVNKDGERETNFINCVAFGSAADFVAQHVHEGDKFNITSSVSTNSYKDKDNNNRYSVDFIVSQHEFAETKAEKERRLANKANATAAQASQMPNAYPQVQPGMVMQNVAPVQAPQVNYAAVQQPQPQMQVQYTQQVPMMPQAPVAQSIPAMPVAPTMPQTPVAPVAPVTPVAPAMPTAPIIPGSEYMSGMYDDSSEELPFN